MSGLLPNTTAVNLGMGSLPDALANRQDFTHL